jgi:hypothetical protein
MSGPARLLQSRQLLLLIRRQKLINLRLRSAPDRSKLAHLAAFGGRQLLDLCRIVGLDRSLKRLPRLLQLLPDRLSGLPSVLENRLSLHLLGCRQVQVTGKKRATVAVPVTIFECRLGRKQTGGS